MRHLRILKRRGAVRLELRLRPLSTFSLNSLLRFSTYLLTSFDWSAFLGISGGPLIVHSIDEVNGGIDKCLKDNSRLEAVLWAVLILMMLVGLSVLGYGIFQGNKWLVGISVGETGLGVWPVRSLIRLHKRRIALVVVPEITVLLSPRDAAREIHALIQLLLERT